MLQKPDVKYQYSDTEQYYGNDCLITLVVTVVEVECCFIATCTRIVSGWMGQDSDSASKVFKSYKEAEDYCEKYMENHGLLY